MPPQPPSVYRTEYSVSDPSGKTVSLSLDGLRDRVLGEKGWWRISGLFYHSDQLVQRRLSDLREAAMSMDAPYALGAVLLACAYRRSLLQGDESVKLKGLAR